MKDCGNGSEQKCDTIVEKGSVKLGTRGFFRVMDLIQILFLRLNWQLSEAIYNFLFLHF